MCLTLYDEFFLKPLSVMYNIMIIFKNIKDGRKYLYTSTKKIRIVEYDWIKVDSFTEISTNISLALGYIYSHYYVGIFHCRHRNIR